MHFFKSLIAAASLVSLALAQTPVIAFTSVPAVVIAGQSYNITWGGGDGTPVTLTLRQGNPDNLETVETLADKVDGNSFMWRVSKDLPTASNYALQITQAQYAINYSGLFSLVGGSGSSSLSYSGYVTTVASTASSNGTGTITTHGSTITPAGTLSAGTGTALPRNTTFSSQALTSSSRAATTVHAASGTQTTSAPSGNAANHMGSSAALVVGLFGAIMVLA